MGVSESFMSRFGSTYPRRSAQLISTCYTVPSHRSSQSTDSAFLRPSVKPDRSKLLRKQSRAWNFLSLRQADQIRGDLYGIQDDLDFIKVQLAQLPTRNEVWRAAMLGGAVAAVTLVEAFARSRS